MKNILLVHHRLPYPLTNGMDKLRFNLICTLSKKYKVTLAVPVFTDTKQEWIDFVSDSLDELLTINISISKKSFVQRRVKYLQRFYKLFIKRHPNYMTDNYYPEFSVKLQEFLNERKFYFVQFLSDFSAFYLDNVPYGNFVISGPMDDMIELSKREFLLSDGILKRIGLRFLKRATVSYFKYISLNSNLVLFHSAEDLIRVKNVLRLEFNCDTLPVATETRETAEAPYKDADAFSLIFVGGMGTAFNQDAVFYFVKEILPEIRSKIPQVKLYLIGNNPPESIEALNNNSSIIVTGAVSDVRPYIRKAGVYISPLRIGTGIKTKVIEAMSLSKALVVTRASLQGLWEVDDSLIVCEDSHNFAEKVIDLLQNNELRNEYERKSGDLFNRAYSYSKVEQTTLNKYYQFEKLIPE